MEVSSQEMVFMGLLDLAWNFGPYLLLGLGVIIGVATLMPKRKDRDH